MLVIWIVVLQLVSFAMGNITDASIDPWYIALSKSSLTPPGFVFGIVWTILYAMLAVTGWLLFKVPRADDDHLLRKLFVAQLVLNWAWTPLFFYFHLIGAALVCLASILLLTLAILRASFYKNRPVFYLMLPYGAWLCFAAYLNEVIWLMN